MTQHPVRAAFEYIDDRASSDFRETLRARLLADLVAPMSIDTAFRKDTKPQETIVTSTNDLSPSTTGARRVLLGIAAAVIVAVGVTAIVINRNNAGTDAASDSDSTIGSGDLAFSQPVIVTGEALVTFDSTAADPAVGQPAPLLNGFDFESNPIAVDPAANGPYMIVFLAHWCPHCNAEIPRLLDWKASGAVPAELNVLGVATAVASSGPNFPPGQWFSDKGWSWPVMVDESQGEGNAGKAASAYGATGWPYFVIIGADGLVKARVSGEIEISDLQVVIDDALAA